MLLSSPVAPQLPTRLMIAGHSFSLRPGRRYLASRKVTDRPSKLFMVLITELTGAEAADLPVYCIGPISLESANRLIAAFNDCQKAFAGRVWE